jgi:Spy/CpxP family protein refolding chaperone
MNKSILTCRLTMALAVLLICGVARAKPGSPPPKDHQAREKLEALRVWRLTEELQLTEDQSAQFFPKLRRIRELRDTRRANRERLTNALTEEVAKDQLSTPRLRQLLDSLQVVDDNSRAAEARVRREMNELLTIEQQAKLYLFQANFDRQTRHVIRQIERDRKSDSPKGR